ncbi:hypothetical protein HDK77DRAFT_76160 [Phyllosticta capitalensis]
MFAVRRHAARAAQSARVQLARQSRRSAHHSHSSAHHDVPADEPIGAGFWMVVGLIPVSWGVYKLAQPDKEGKLPWLTRAIDYYGDWREQALADHVLHTRFQTQAGFDKNLLFNSKPHGYHTLRTPEMFNTGSPFNVPAGFNMDLTKVVEHYERENYEANRLKHEQIKNGAVPCEQPPGRMHDAHYPDRFTSKGSIRWL